MLGHGFESTRKPPVLSGSDLPCLSTISGTTPKNGRVAQPGVVSVTPGSGVIMIAPVSVCHHVSTIGQRLPPMTRWYQTHASGLIGSPTVPRSRNDERSYCFGHLSPHL